MHYAASKISTRTFSVLEILSFLFFVCGLLLLTAVSKSEKRDRNLQVLKPHFEAMLKVSPDIIPNLIEDNGLIYLPNSSLDRLSKLPLEFAAHFPRENDTWNTCCSDVKKYDKKYSEFVLKIKALFESSGFRVMLDNQISEPPYIYYEAGSRALFMLWEDRFNHNNRPRIDFTLLDFNVPIYGPVNLVVPNWAAIIACA